MEPQRFLQLHARAFLAEQVWVGEGFWRVLPDDPEADLLRMVVGESLSQSLAKLAGLSEFKVYLELTSFVVVKPLAAKLDEALAKTEPQSPDRIAWTLTREPRYMRRWNRG